MCQSFLIWYQNINDVLHHVEMAGGQGGGDGRELRSEPLGTFILIFELSTACILGMLHTHNFNL